MPLKIRSYIPFAASVFFYIYSSSVVSFTIMLGMSVFVWAGALGLEKYSKHKKAITVSVIAIMAIILMVYKENLFFINNGNWLLSILGIEKRIPAPNWVAPLGISYFTFILLGYFIDVSWGKYKAERNPIKVMFFACYFPQMVSGPFTRYNEIGETLFTGHKFNYDKFTFGIQRFLWGLFKVIVVSERLAKIVSQIYATYSEIGGGFVLIGAISYAAQLYSNFSGSMDIILGVSEMLGIKLPENFLQPFNSRSLSEVWQRWHITLGFWLKDYVMYPVRRALGKKFGKKLKAKLGKKAGQDIVLYISMLVTWFCVGFWHGGSWKYICSSGLFFFVMIVGGLLLRPLFDKLKKMLKINTEAWSWHLFESVRSFLLFMFSVSFGRAVDLTDGFLFWKTGLTNIKANFLDLLYSMFDKTIWDKIGIDEKEIIVLAISLVLILIVSTLQLSSAEKGGIRERLAKQNIVYRWLVWLVLLFAIVIFGCYGPGYDPAAFIYAGF
ncbi:MAG: hypothetical protein LBC27_05465 [Spirochaetaceae bacterium]|nr:hypothetical protein [Spirochaetaceae bacterium]